MSGTISSGAPGTQTLTFGAPSQSGGSFTVSATISDGTGTLALNKTGLGDVTLTGANSYSGSTDVQAGRLVASGSGFGIGDVTVNTGGEIFVANSGTLSNNFFIAGDGGNSSIDSQPRGAIRIENSTIGAGGTVTLQNDASIGSYNNGTGTVNAPIGEAGGARSLSINQSAANAPGTIVLGGANTYSGDTNVENGTLELTATGSLQNANVFVNNSATFLQSGGQNNITGSGTNPHLTVGAGANYTLNGGVLDFQDNLAGALGNSASTMQIDGTFSFNAGTLIDVDTIDPSGGTGVFNQSGGDFIVGRDATGPGPIATNILGGFTQTGGALHLDIFGPTSVDIDMLIATEDVNLSGDLEIDFTTANVQNFVWYDAVKSDGVITFDGQLSGGVWQILNGPNGSVLQVAIPEPSSVLLWTLLTVGLAGYARRRRRLAAK